MKAQLQIGLRVGASLLVLLALALFAEPMSAHKAISSGAYDSATHFLLAANLLGLAVIIFVVAANPQADTLGALAAALLIPGLVAFHQMLVSGTMPLNIHTVAGLIAIVGFGMYLMLGRTQDLSETAPARVAKKPAKKAKKKAAPKKKAKKKVAKKAKKKAAKKKRR